MNVNAKIADLKIAVLIPCYNEAATIEKVIKDFSIQLPGAYIYVCDNNSSDDTYEIAKLAGAIVLKESRQGKGNVVRTLFREVDADVYILVDGDDTYPAEVVRQLLQPILNDEADIVLGDRISNGAYSKENKRAFHGFGNNMVRRLINILFKSDLEDIMTGYRAFNRYFVKTLPVLSKGFEIETEMTIFSLHNNYKIKEVPIEYRDRPEGSVSKLNTYTDGIKVIRIVFSLFKDYKPLAFFGSLGLLFCIVGLIIGMPAVIEYVETKYVWKVPSTVLAASLEIIALLLFAIGLILDTTVKHQRMLHEQQATLFKFIDGRSAQKSISDKEFIK
jgi:glycosyltransferase involved in cell wall biosynthesis